MQTVALARYAMATRFEIVVQGARDPDLRAAGEEALDEIDRLEGQLSLYRPGSEISRVNAMAARQGVRVSPPVFQLLALARKLHDEVDGTFDITIAPLVRAFGFMDGRGKLPPEDELSAARACVGMRHIFLDESNFTVNFDREGVMLDLGAIGKGYAIEQAAMILREAGVERALIHGGTSTVYAIGKPADAESWKVAIQCPPETASVNSGKANLCVGEKDDFQERVRAIVSLENEALSVSAVWGKFFESGGKELGHVLDPRSGAPVCNAVMAAVVVPSATESDAFSTALLVAGPDGHDPIARLRSPMRTLVVAPGPDAWITAGHGIQTI